MPARPACARLSAVRAETRTGDRVQCFRTLAGTPAIEQADCEHAQTLPSSFQQCPICTGHELTPLAVRSHGLRDRGSAAGLPQTLSTVMSRQDAIHKLNRFVYEPVLLRGQNGTGKELIARAIHAIAPRCSHLSAREQRGIAGSASGVDSVWPCQRRLHDRGSPRSKGCSRSRTAAPYSSMKSHP